MYGFVVVLIFIFFGFALIAIEFDEAQTSYGDQLYGTFKILFANYDDGEYNVSQKLSTALIVFLLNVVLMNLLISIMGDTYGRVQEKRVLIDSLTRLDMSLEAMVYMKALRLTGKKQEKGYLIYCETESLDDDENAENVEWQGRINVITKALRQNDATMQEMMNLIGEQREEITSLKKQGTTMEQELMNSVGKINTLIGEQKEEITSLKKQGTTMEKDMKEILSQMTRLASLESSKH